jgi:hypothetical protein
MSGGLNVCQVKRFEHAVLTPQLHRNQSQDVFRTDQSLRLEKVP